MKKPLLFNLILLLVAVLFVQDSRAETTLEGHTWDVTSVAFSPDGTILASGSGDGTVRLWDVATRTNTATLEDNLYGVESVAFSPDGTTLATASLYSIKLWDVATRTSTDSLKGEYFESVAFSPEGTTLATASFDGLKLWDVATRKSTAILEDTPYGGVESVVFSSDGTLATASDDNIKLWDVATGNAAILGGHTRDVTSVAFSRDGTLLVSGSDDDTVKLWDVVTRTNTATFAGHTDNVTSVALSPDGATIVSGSEDGTVKLWDVATGTAIATLEGHTNGVLSVAYSPDGTTVASGSEDKTIKLWDVAEAVQPQPAGLVIISGNAQQGTPGAALPYPLIVEVQDQYGNPLPGIEVTFAITAGEGKLSGQFTVEHVTTDANGRAQGTLTLGPGPRTYTLVRVSAEQGFVIFAVGTPDTPRNRDGDYWTWHVPDGVTARMSKGWILDIAYSDDGARLAVGSSIGVWVYDARTGIEVDFLTRHASEVRNVAFSLDGSTLASGDGDGIIHLWDVTTGQHLHTLTGHTSAINSLAFSLNGTLASGSWGIIRLWDATTGQHLRGFTPKDMFGKEGSVNSVAFSPDGSTLASAGESGLKGTIYLWDVTTGQHKNTLTRTGNLFEPNNSLFPFEPNNSLFPFEPNNSLFPEATDYYSVAFSPDGSTLASAGRLISNDIIDLWDMTTGQYKNTLTRTGNLFDFNPDNNTLGFIDYYSIAFSRDGSTLASGGANFFGDGIIDLWDPTMGQLQQSLPEQAWPVRKVMFSRDGRFASGGGEDLYLWDATGLPLNTITGHSWLGRNVAFSADGTLASGNWSGTIDLWNRDTWQHKKSLKAHPWAVRGVAFSPDGSTLASVAGKLIHLWDTVTGQHKMSLPGGSDGGGSDGGQRQGSGHGIGIAGLGLGDTSGGLTGIRLGGITFGLGGGGGGSSDPLADEPVIYSVAFSRDSSMLVAGCGGSEFHGCIHFRDATTGELLNEITGLEADVWSVAFSPDGTLASGSTDGVIRLWNVSSEQPLNTLEGHTSEVWSVAFSSDGKTLASGSADGTIRLWDVTSGQPEQTLQGHTNDVRSIAFSPNDSILASGSLDRTIRLWDVASGQPEQTLQGHLSEVWSVAFSRDGSILASGSLDGTILLWDVSEWTNSGTAVAANKLIGLPNELQLQQNAPNPFNSQTVISYFLPKSGPVRLELFSVIGQRVAVLHQGLQPAGYHQLHWEARDSQGRPLASGMYLYRLVTDEGILTRKLTLLR